ncbi:MAG: hypothetical protein LLG00_01935 [Planctomycetaceae bacterium]|nr:hypothetical protein [Planctomycetaceae bacterium]
MNSSRWQFSLRGLLLFTLSVAIGLSFWKMEHAAQLVAANKVDRSAWWALDRHDWYVGVLAAISFWIVLGLASQARDVWQTFRRANDATSEERWAWRFAVAWRIAICCLIGIYFLFQLLVELGFLSLGEREQTGVITSWQICDATLLISILTAAASSPRLAQRRRPRKWSWAVDLLGGIAVAVLFTILLLDQMIVPAFGHIVVTGIQMAWPLDYSAGVLDAASPIREMRFFCVATAGVISVAMSCFLVRLLAHRWHAAGWQRVCVATLSMTSLAATVLLAGRVALVEVPGFSPIMAANIPMPSPPLFVAAAVLTLLLATPAARRWSECPTTGHAADVASWRGDETRYHHERLLLILFLGAVALAECVYGVRRLVGTWYCSHPWRATVWCVAETPAGFLSFALILLSVQGMFSGWRKTSHPCLTHQSRLRPGLFVVLWSSLTTIVLCSAPIIAAWLFLLWLRVGWPFRGA